MTALLDLAMRWLHILAAILLLGGALFLRFVLMPAARTLAPDPHQQLAAAVMQRWRMFVHLGIGLLLVSGLYNTAHQIGLHKGQPLYHALLGVKILLALAVFALASMLVGRSPAAQRLRAHADRWMALNLLLALLVVLLGGYLRSIAPHVTG